MQEVKHKLSTWLCFLDSACIWDPVESYLESVKAHSLVGKSPYPSSLPWLKWEVTMVQEYILSDFADFFKHNAHWLEPSQARQSASQAVEIIHCCVAFMPASYYINNIYLRAQLAEVTLISPRPSSRVGAAGQASGSFAKVLIILAIQVQLRSFYCSQYYRIST